MNLLRRLRFAVVYREWPCPAEVVALAGTKRPPEHVFEQFRRLHGLESHAERRGGQR